MRMKLTLALLLFGILQVHSSVISQTIDYSSKNGTLVQLFSAIEKQTGYTVFCNKKVLENANPVSITAKGMPLKEFMDKVMEGQPSLLYEIEGITIFVKETDNKERGSNDRLVFSQAADFPLPPVKIKGKIISESAKEPMSDVSVRIKKKNSGTTSDKNGVFELNVETGDVLVITYVGYEDQEITIKDLTEQLIIRMKLKDTEMTGVVLTGIFNRRAESFTGAAQTYNQDQLRRVGNANLIQSLKNLDPSFSVTENLQIGSNPNAMPEIQLRGQSGFPDLRGEYQTNPNQPLFILDGFEIPLSQVIDMDMYRVASVTLLKDAAAKAIYGSKAANGVVVIETKRPEKGRMRVTYTGSMNVQTPDLTSYNLTNASEKLIVEKNGGVYDAPASVNISGVILENAETKYQNLLKYNNVLEEVLRGVNTDWLSKPLQTGIGQKHVVYLEGGDESLTYGVDLSYNGITGAMIGSKRNTMAGGITLAYRRNKITFRNKLEVSHVKGTNSPYGVFSEYAKMNPYYRAEGDDGKINKIAGTSIQLGQIYNPLWNSTINTKNITDYTQIINNFYIDYQVLRDLKLNGRFGITRQDNSADIFHPASHTDFINYTSEELLPRRGRYTQSNGAITSVTADLTASYTFRLNEHLLFANAGWNLNQYSSNSTTIVAEGFTNDRMDDISFAKQYLKDGSPNAIENTTHDLGVLASVNYSYDNRFLFDFSARTSASSQFGSENRWGKFWALGAGWNLHNEAFLLDKSYIDTWKIRGSIGFTGSQGFNSYMSQATYTYNTTTTYLGNNGAYLLAIANDKLKWQRKKDANIGTDISLFDRRLNIRAEYYQSTTDNLLTEVTIPSSTGFTSYKENLGKVKNTGYELYASVRAWANPTRELSVNLYASVSHNKNKIQKISNSLAAFNNEKSSEVTSKPVVRYSEGQSFSAIWAVPSRGIDPATGQEIYVQPDGSITTIWNANNLAVVGDTEPYLDGNAGVNFTYKGLMVNLGMLYRFGGQMYNQTLVDKVENANIYYNVDRRIFEDRWVKPGDVTKYKNIADKTTTRATSRFVEDDDLWQLSSINVSYELSRFLKVNSIGVNRLRLSFDMADAARISSVRMERGTDYPFARTFSLSLQAMF